jgi:phosphoglucosamine mutase
MRKSGCNIGGEQSGHIILGEYGSTGDGLVASLQIIASMVEKNIKVSKLVNIFSLMPQTIESISYNNKDYKYKNSDHFIKEKIKKHEKKLGDEGRIIIRASGTENKLRIMGECKNKTLLNNTLKKLKTEIINYINE